jgi:hypothetical protein
MGPCLPAGRLSMRSSAGALVRPCVADCAQVGSSLLPKILSRAIRARSEPLCPAPLRIATRSTAGEIRGSQGVRKIHGINF